MSDWGDDISLVRRFKEGDERAFNEIVRRYQKRLYQVSLRMVGNHEDATDISQDAFVKAYYGLKKFRETSSLYTWLYRIVINLSINHQKRKKVIDFISLESLSANLRSTKGSPDKEVNRTELGEAIERAVAELPERQKAIFILRQYENLSHNEIAQILGRSVGAVRANYFHAVKKLRKALAQFMDE